MTVVDASVALKWFVEEDGADAAAGLIGQQLAAPALIFGEITNTLWKKVRQGAVTAPQAQESLAALPQFFAEIVPLDVLAAHALRLATELNHPAYDCCYLALAEMRDEVLITADLRFVQACGNTAHAGRLRLLGPA